MNQYKKVAFHTLGCKLNFSETSTIAKEFQKKGYAIVDPFEFPDIVVVNTCSVTENADKKCALLVRKSLSLNPDIYVIIVGCFAQLKPEKIKSIKGVNLVLGANEKFNIVSLFEKHNEDKSVVYNSKIKEANSFIPSFSTSERTRSFLKIQDGCDYFCSFCTIPLARGKSRNGSINSVIKQVNQIAKQGVKEIVLTGVNIGDFGQGSIENFFSLIKSLDTANNNIKRYRISSIEPNLLSHEIIDFVASSKSFMPHFHIPLQSGSDLTLARMRRKYSTELFKDRVKKIKEVMPHACIGADVIVGFPGETKEDFESSLSFITSLPLSYLHVFTYSERANTTAKKLKESVSTAIRKKRSLILREVSNKMKHQFYNAHLNQDKKVLFENKTSDGLIYGFTENYIKVVHPFINELSNTIKVTRLNKLSLSKSAVNASVIE